MGCEEQELTGGDTAFLSYTKFDLIFEIMFLEKEQRKGIFVLFS